ASIRYQSPSATQRIPAASRCHTLPRERPARRVLMTNTSSRLTAEAIYEELRDRICLLDLPPGAPLREQALAEEFGVSRTPVREALTMLRVDGLVVRRQGGGTSVSTVDLKRMRVVYSLRIKLSELTADYMKIQMPSHIPQKLRELCPKLLKTAPSRDPKLLGFFYD